MKSRPNLTLLNVLTLNFDKVSSYKTGQGTSNNTEIVLIIHINYYS